MLKVGLSGGIDNAVLGLGARTVPPPGHQEGETNAKHDCVHAEDVDVVLAIDDPSRQRNAHRHLLLAIWVTIELEVLPDGLIRQRLVCFCKLNVVALGLLFGLVVGEDKLIGMKLDREALVVLFDLLLRGGSSNAEDLERIIDGVGRIAGSIEDGLEEVGNGTPAGKHENSLGADLRVEQRTLLCRTDKVDLLTTRIPRAFLGGARAGRSEERVCEGH